MFFLIERLPDIVGIFGVSLILIAYFLVSANYWLSHDLIYQIFNFVGSWCILFSLYFHFNLSSVMIEIAWITISLIGMYKVFLVWRRK